MDIFIIILGIIAVVLIIQPYTLKYDNLFGFTGGLGSGKTFTAVRTALTLYHKARFKVRWHNFFHPRHKEPLPELYTNIPVRIGLFKYSIRLTAEHLLLQRRIVPRSICFLDEVDIFANQFQYNNPAIVSTKGGEDAGNFDECVRLFRQYTLGGYLIFTTQATSNENLVIRRRQNSVFMLFGFRKWGIPLIAPNIFFTTRVRHVILSDEMKTIVESNAEDGMRLLVGFMPFIRHYDTYCYSGRYETVPYKEERRFESLKTNECLIAPVGKQPKYTTNVDVPQEPPKPLKVRIREWYRDKLRPRIDRILEKIKSFKRK